MARSRNITPTRRWMVAAASVAGAKHTRRNAPNEDRFHCLTADDDRLIIAVCDGAGSAPLGGEGARVAAAAALDSIRRQLDMETRFSLPEILEGAFHEARKSVIRTAENSGLPVRDYDTTITLFTQLGGRSAAAQLGDGACVVRTAGAWHLINEPQRGQYANETFFLTQEDAGERLALSPEMSSVEDVMVCTDGMSALTLQQPDNVPHSPYFDGTFSWLRSCHDPRKASSQMERLLLSDRVRRITDDDLTMVQATLLNPNVAQETKDATG